MWTNSTITQPGAIRLIGIIASTLVAAILVVGFVVASTGIGFESYAGHGPMPAPAPLMAAPD